MDDRFFDKEKQLDCGYRIDVLVEKSIFLELKAVDKIEAIHKAQLLTYLINIFLSNNYDVLDKNVVCVSTVKRGMVKPIIN